MEEQTCVKCKKSKLLYEFNKNSTTKLGISTYCKECVRDASKFHYSNNKEKIKKRVYQLKKELRKWFEDYKSTLKCARCPEKDPVCLEFHHLDPSKKDRNISDMICYHLSKDKIIKEMEKCIVLCANCHKKEHIKYI